MFRSSRGLRSAHPDSLQLPEYPLPPALETVLDINEKSTLDDESLMYSKVLESLITVKYVDLSESHYIQLLKLALYLEEYQSNEEMKKRKLFMQKIQRASYSRNSGGVSFESGVNDQRRLFHRKFQKAPHASEVSFKIHVKDLDEERPWIRENDFVDVIDTRSYKTYTLKVTSVTKTDIIACDDAASLNRVYKPWHLYNINFRFQNYPLRCNHYALWLAYKHSVITYLFPYSSKSFIKMDSKVDTGLTLAKTLTMLNPNIETNPEQKQAVLNIVNKSSHPAPYILYGPPGTGKTATLVEAICQILTVSSMSHVLVCTPSNTAADEIAKRLIKFIPAHQMYRIYSQAKNRSTIDVELKNCSYCGNGEKTSLSREDIAGKSIFITTLCTATKFLLMKLNADYFSHIIIDEAGQGTEPDILIPISIASKDGKLYSQVVLAGDPKQLGPTVISKLADIILGRSILERLMSYEIYQKDCHNNYNPKYITKLLNNYRSHPSIIHISNKLFYENELVAKVAKDNEKMKFPVIFHGVEGVEEKYSYSPSTMNKQEINLVMKYVYDLLKNKTEFGEISAKDIGIVTPFTLQSKRIQKLLRAKDDEEKKKLDQENAEKLQILQKNAQSVRDSQEPADPTSNDKKTAESKIENEHVKQLDVEAEIESGDLESGSKTDDNVLDTDDAKLKLKDKTKRKKKAAEKKNDAEKKKIECMNFRDINVGTVELFQGQERKIMIMTAVRSKTFFHNGKEHIGFLSNPKRFNVAMSRAQDALIVIGNPGILQKDKMWRFLLNYCIDNESYRGLDFEKRASSDEKLDLSAVSDSQNIATSASLFKQQPFILFQLSDTDSILGKRRTVQVFLEREKVAEQRPLHKILKELNLDTLSYK